MTANLQAPSPEAVRRATRCLAETWRATVLQSTDPQTGDSLALLKDERIIELESVLGMLLLNVGVPLSEITIPGTWRETLADWARERSNRS